MLLLEPLITLGHDLEAPPARRRVRGGGVAFGLGGGQLGAGGVAFGRGRLLSPSRAARSGSAVGRRPLPSSTGAALCGRARLALSSLRCPARRRSGQADGDVRGDRELDLDHVVLITPPRK